MLNEMLDSLDHLETKITSLEAEILKRNEESSRVKSIRILKSILGSMTLQLR